MNENIRIMLVEDHPGYRETIALGLEDEPGMELTEMFATAEAGLRCLQEANPPPDVILLDLNLPGMHGLDAIRWILEYAPQTEIIVLTQSSKTTEVQRAIQEGASGYLLKSANLTQIIEGIKVVASGGSSIDPDVARYILNTFRKQPPTRPEGKSLSQRERAVLELLAEGLAKKEVADRLDISITTVKYHVRHIYEKLRVPNAAAAISKAYRAGILGSNPPREDD